MPLLGAKPAIERDDADPQLVDLGETDDQVFAVLQSKTARDILLALYEEPAVPSDLSEQVGTSLQNIHYHIEKLQAAGLVTVVDTWYSSKGVEMDVYAPTGNPLMLVMGGGDELVR